MSKCPDRDCREEILGKMASIEKCTSKKVPRSWVWWFIAVFGVALVSFGGSTWYTAKSAEDKAEKLEQLVDKNARSIKELTVIVNDNFGNTIRCDERFKAITKSLEVIEKKIDK